MSEEYTREEIEQMLRARIKKYATDFTGSIVVSKYKDEKIFKYPTAEEEVVYFREIFAELRKKSDANYVWYRLKESVDNRLEENSENLLEAYLYALKLEDGCFGSELRGNSVNQEMLSAYEKAVAHIYENKKYRNKFMEVMKHVLVNWEWYQPLLLVISLFGDYPECGDEEVDEIMRTHLLFRKIFSRTTFLTLCHRPTEENFKALFDFLKAYNNKDVVTGNIFIPDRYMIEAFDDAMKLPENSALREYLKDIYRNTYDERSIIRPMRRWFEKWFGRITPSEGDWQNIFVEYDNYSEEQKEKELRNIRLNFRLEDEAMRREIEHISNQDIMDIISDKIKDANFATRCRGILLVGKNRNEAAKKFLRKNALTYGKGKREEFIYMLACFLQFDAPGIEEICKFFFLNEEMEDVGLQVPMLKQTMNYKKQPDKFRQCLENLIRENSKDKGKTDLIIQRCRHFFGSGYTNPKMYPAKIMMSFLKEKLNQALKEDDSSLVRDILVIIKYAASKIESRPYEEMLLSVTHNADENSVQFNYARSIISEVFGR
uniref:hypothetical protein n=1 Tax=Agathobacter sp. TaxID=2021311 RepID=UPI004056F3C1